MIPFPIRLWIMCRGVVMVIDAADGDWEYMTLNQGLLWEGDANRAP
jgi:hypothetical protein